MKKYLLSTIAGIAMTAIAPLAQAADHTVSVCMLQVTQSGGVFLAPCGTWISVAGNNNGWIYWDANSAGGQAMYQTALVAQTLAQPVTVRIDPNNSTATYDTTSLVRILP